MTGDVTGATGAVTTAVTGDPIRTLIVDDDPAVVRLHSAYLRDIPGFALVGTVRTGTQAARFASNTAVDLVLLDMNLPDFSGIEVLHRLRLVRDWSVDVMVVSSARDGFTVRQALAAHVVGYLVKPFTREAFAERLTEYRRSRAERPPEVPVGLAQGEIDRLVAPAADAGRGELRGGAHSPGSAIGGATTGQPLPKGLSEPTLRTILDALHLTSPVTAQAISAASGASPATVRRYLAYLSGNGYVAVSHRFGARGRPEVLYRRASPVPPR
ncbi:response regulator [Marisediminicola senii]|uniref:response regulator n=1 Tax=Marisediminicola senii TaxID=2711233 RepID=UPI001F3D3B67|nr:response regulator [Marisediminicola senii]